MEGRLCKGELQRFIRHSHLHCGFVLLQEDGKQSNGADGMDRGCKNLRDSS